MLATEILIKNILMGDKIFQPEIPSCQLIVRHSTGPILKP